MGANISTKSENKSSSSKKLIKKLTNGGGGEPVKSSANSTVLSDYFYLYRNPGPLAYSVNLIKSHYNIHIHIEISNHDFYIKYIKINDISENAKNKTPKIFNIAGDGFQVNFKNKYIINIKFTTFKDISFKINGQLLKIINKKPNNMPNNILNKKPNNILNKKPNNILNKKPNNILNKKPNN